MNDRFREIETPEEMNNYEYAEMILIVTKVIPLDPGSAKNKSVFPRGECAYVDGVVQDLYNTCHVKIEKMTAGRYIFFYTAKFRKDQLCRKLNVIFNTSHDITEMKLTRISAKQFGSTFLADLERINLERSWEED